MTTFHMQIMSEGRVSGIIIRYKLAEDSNDGEDVLYAEDTCAVISDKFLKWINLHSVLEIKVVSLCYLRNNISFINITDIIECFKNWITVL